MTNNKNLSIGKIIYFQDKFRYGLRYRQSFMNPFQIPIFQNREEHVLQKETKNQIKMWMKALPNKVTSIVERVNFINFES